MMLPSKFVRFSDSVELELRSQIARDDVPLYKIMAYHMGWVGTDGEQTGFDGIERLHSTICMSVCEGLGGSVNNAVVSSAAVELVHNFSLIHNDIQNGEPNRNDRPSVWWEWGPAQGINAGDGMHALARLGLLSQLDNGVSHEQVLKSVYILDIASLEMCQGQYLDISYQERVDVAEGSYLEMASLKTASLMSCAAQLGAVAAGVDEQAISSIAMYGKKLGIAYQIRSDILDLWGQNENKVGLYGDILNKKKSFPIIYALRNATGVERRKLGDVYFKRVMDPEDVSAVLEILHTLGAKDYSQRKADSLCMEAISAMEKSRPTKDGLVLLRQLALFLSGGES